MRDQTCLRCLRGLRCLKCQLICCFALLVALFVISGCVPQPAPSPLSSRQLSIPEISGVIAADRTLSGTTIIVGDTTVAIGVVLTIEPGSTLLIRVSDSTKVAPEYLSPLTEIIVKGELHLLGTPENRVKLLPESTAYGDDPLWAGITFITSSGSEIHQTYIERADNAVQLIDSDLILTKSVIKGSRYAVVQQGASNSKIDQSLFEDGEAGVFCFGGSMSISQSEITGNEEEGLLVSEACSLTAERLDITENAVGVVASQDFILGVDSIVENNRQFQFKSIGGVR